MNFNRTYFTLVLCSTISIANSAFADSEGDSNPTITITDVTKIFTKGIESTVDTGRVYVENSDFLKEKRALFECAVRYLQKFPSDFSAAKSDIKTLREYHACITLANAGDISPKNPQFAGFEAEWIQIEDDEEYAKRNFVSRMWSNKNVIDLPNPLVLFKKAAEDIAKFAFVKSKEGSQSPQESFVAIVKDGILLVLERNRYGDEAYAEKMKGKLRALHALCKSETIFQSADRNEAIKEEELSQKYAPQVLIEIGQTIGSILASSGGLLVLPEEGLEQLGTSVANILNPTYTNILKANKERTNYQLKLGEQIALGDKVIKEVERIKTPAQLQDDLDAKFLAMSMVLAHIYQVGEAQASNKVKKAEYAEKNPLSNAFKI